MEIQLSLNDEGLKHLTDWVRKNTDDYYRDLTEREVQDRAREFASRWEEDSTTYIDAVGRYRKANYTAFEVKREYVQYSCEFVDGWKPLPEDWKWGE